MKLIELFSQDKMHLSFEVFPPKTSTAFESVKHATEEIAKLLKDTRLTEFRETHHEVNGVEVICRVAKGQNATAASTVFEQVSKDPSIKEVVIMLDEMYSDPKKQETVAWIYDTDYEFLNRDNIHRIVIGGLREKDHLLRLLLAGVPREKIFCTPDVNKVADIVSGKNVEKIFILHDVNAVSMGHSVRDQIKEKMTKKGDKVNAC